MAAPTIILASSSAYRRNLLQQLGLSFEVVEPSVDESPRPGERPEALVKRLALSKAKSIARNHTAALVIGADQVAVHGDTIVGKPRDHAHARQQLRQASGKTVTLYTGIAVINADSGRVQTDVVPFRVVFRDLDDAQIESYLRTEQPYDCTGSVKAEGLGIALLTRFEGEDPNALIGLPLIRLVRMLENEGVQIL
ncbi:MAG: Maf family protein [Acidiferrobacterales bacterium]